MVHLLFTPFIFVLVGPPVGAIVVGGGVLAIFGAYGVGSWPALVAGVAYIGLSGATERILHRAELSAICGALLGVLAALSALLFCFPAEHWWHVSKVARWLLFPGILAGAAAGVVSAMVASKLARDMAPT